jgi:hypothetical protein
MLGSVMAEIQFADGIKTVDDVYVEPIYQVTDGVPERHPFQTVMDQLADWQTRQILKRAQRTVIEEHFREWG